VSGERFLRGAAVSLKPRHLLWLAGWALAAHGVLALGILPVDLGHALCGPWGCAPPLQALAAMHAFWALALLPPTACALSLLSARSLRLVGSIVMGLGLAGLGFVFARELLVWLPSVPPEVQRYFPQRLLFVLATLSDVPLVQVTLAGAVCWAVSRNRRATSALDGVPTAKEPAGGLHPGMLKDPEANGCPDRRMAGQL
jgi:hypothetical protein